MNYLLLQADLNYKCLQADLGGGVLPAPRAGLLNELMLLADLNCSLLINLYKISMLWQADLGRGVLPAPCAGLPEGHGSKL